MPTGTGKTAVIAALTCGSALLRRTLILTPRAGLVQQMKADLSYQFWGRVAGALYRDCEVREAVPKDEFEEYVAAVKAGKIAPVRELAAEQYGRIWAEQDQTRQILVSTFNALHLILGIEPPAHRSMHGRDARAVAQSLQRLTTDKPHGGRLAFQQLLKDVDLVIVDEGHYEPAYSWSQAVRAIGKPTIIFSATPYRNDYKYFQINGNFVFNLPWQEAVQERLIREVRFQPPAQPLNPVKKPPPNTVGGYSAEAFVKEFSQTLAELPAGKRVIVHAATFRALNAFAGHGPLGGACEGQRARQWMGNMSYSAFSLRRRTASSLRSIPRPCR